MTRGLVWFRRDLRVRDNLALSAAIEECREVLGLFVFDEPLLKSNVFGSACVNFMLGCLKELLESLEEIGVPLLYARGNQDEEVARIVRERTVERIYWNRDYEPAAVDRNREREQRTSGFDGFWTVRSIDTPRAESCPLSMGPHDCRLIFGSGHYRPERRRIWR